MHKKHTCTSRARKMRIATVRKTLKQEHRMKVLHNKRSDMQNLLRTQ